MAQNLENPIPSIQEAKHGRHQPILRYSHHAAAIRMIERGITRSNVEASLNDSNVRILEIYGDKSPSCRIQGFDETRRPLQVIVAYKVMIVVTVYSASDADFMTEDISSE